MIIHHVIDGPVDGDPVVLLPSLGATHAMWDRNVEDFAAAGFRLVRVDPRGHGATPVDPAPATVDDLADDVVRLLDRLEIARAHVIGVSLGGMTALTLGLRAPGRVRSLVPSFTAAHLPPASAWYERAAMVRSAGVAAIADAVLGRWLTPAFAARERAVAAALGDVLRGTDREGYARCCEAIAVFDVRERLSTISAPTLVVAGAADPSTPPEHGAAIADAIPGAHLVVLDDAAHLGNVEHPRAFAEAVLGHLRET